MRPIARLAIISASWLLVVPARPPVLAGQAGPGTTPGGTSIAGRVMDPVSGRPIAGAEVTIHQLSAGSTIFPMVQSGHIIVTDAVQFFGPVMSDQDGRFRFQALPADVFRVMAYKAGWTGGHAGQREPVGRAEWLSTRDRSSLTDLVVPMWKRAMLEGIVRDESGGPVVGASVEALAPEVHAGRERTVVRERAVTDDRGVYRLEVMPGRYRVVALRRLVTSSQFELRPAPQAGLVRVYRRAFYPSAEHLPDASTVIAAPGDVRTGLDIVLPSVRAFAVSGRIVAPGPWDGLQLDLDRELVEDVESDESRPSVSVGADGRFRVPMLPAGAYRIRARRMPPMPMVSHGTAPLESLPGEPTLWGEARVEIVDRDVTATLSLAEGARVRGRVEFDGSSPKPTVENLKRALITLVRADGRFDDLRGAYLAGDRFATIQTPPGTYRLNASRIGPWHLIEAISAGRDIATRPFDLGSADLTDVVLRFSDRETVLRGRVDKARPDSRFQNLLIVLPDDSELWSNFGAASNRIHQVGIGTAGTYELPLLPGGYHVVAIEQSSNVQLTSARLARLAPRATRVWINGGESKVVNVKAIAIEP